MNQYRFQISFKFSKYSYIVHVKQMVSCRIVAELGGAEQARHHTSDMMDTANIGTVKKTGIDHTKVL